MEEKRQLNDDPRFDTRRPKRSNDGVKTALATKAASGVKEREKRDNEERRGIAIERRSTREDREER